MNRQNTPHIEWDIEDIDSNLYGMLGDIRDQVIAGYMSHIIKHGLADNQKEAFNVMNHLYFTYGGANTGLVIEHNHDPKDIIKSLGHIDLSSQPPASEDLKEALRNLPTRKIAYTQSDRAFALRIMEHLGLTPFFEDVVAWDDMGFVQKATPEGFQHLTDRGVEFAKARYTDDSLAPLKMAKQLGVAAVVLNVQYLTDVKRAHYEEPEQQQVIQKSADIQIDNLAAFLRSVGRQVA